MSTKIYPTDQLLGSDVHNANGDKLGELDELMLDARTGQIAYAVVSAGGFLGFGDKRFSVPFPMLELDPQTENLMLDIEKDRLEDAPAFDRAETPRADEDYLNEVYAFYGVDRYWKQRKEDTTTVPRQPGRPTAVGST